MKRIYMTLGLMAALTTGAFAQRNIDLAATLETPDAAFTTNCADSFDYRAYVLNLGPDTLVVGDTVAILDPFLPSGYAYMVTPGRVYSNGSSAPDFYYPGDTLFINEGRVGFDEIENLFLSDGSAQDYKPFDDDDYMFYVLAQAGWNTPADFNDPDNTNNADAVTITVACNTSISGLAKDNSALSVYPNPVTNGVLNFSYSFTTNTVANARIVDATGRTVLTQELGKNTVGTQTFQMNTSSLAPGFYMIEVVTEAGRSISKFTVK